jgi:hypothetical protein
MVGIQASATLVTKIQNIYKIFVAGCRGTVPALDRPETRMDTGVPPILPRAVSPILELLHIFREHPFGRFAG